MIIHRYTKEIKYKYYLQETTTNENVNVYETSLSWEIFDSDKAAF